MRAKEQQTDPEFVATSHAVVRQCTILPSNREQSVFVPAFDPTKGALKGWLSCVTYHRCLRKLRALKRKEWQAGDGELAFSLLDASAKPEQWIRSLDFRKCLEKALISVNEKQRRTMVLYFYEGKELAAIAKEIGESFGNARHHLYRGLAKVRSELVQNRLLEGYTEFGSVESIKKAVR